MPTFQKLTKITWIACTLAAASTFTHAFARGGSTFVHGYTRSNGTYVAPHYRSAPNSTKTDNWSTKGNINPYTGQAGTKILGNNFSTGATYTSYYVEGSSSPVVGGSRENSRSKIWPFLGAMAFAGGAAWLGYSIAEWRDRPYDDTKPGNNQLTVDEVKVPVAVTAAGFFVFSISL
jgi:hypothetical protein